MAAYTIAELCAATRWADRTVRYYVEKGLLPRPKFRGTGTRYTDEHLVRIRAIQHLRRLHYGLRDIKRALRNKTQEQIRALYTPPAPPAPPPPAPPPPAAPIAGPVETSPAASATPATEPAFHASAAWERVALLPGLELHLAGDVEPFVRRIAREIYALYRAKRPDAPDA